MLKDLIKNRYIHHSKLFVIDTRKFTVPESQLSYNLRATVKSIKEITYEPFLGKQPIELKVIKTEVINIEAEEEELQSGIHIIYDELNRMKTIFNSFSDIKTEYSYGDSKENDPIEVKSYNNDQLTGIIKYEYKENLLVRKEIFELEKGALKLASWQFLQYYRGLPIEERYGHHNGGHHHKNIWYTETGDIAIVKEQGKYEAVPGVLNDFISELYYEYDKNGLLVELSGDALLSFEYDQTGNLIKLRDNSTIYIYDMNGNCIQKEELNKYYGETLEKWKYEYDDHNNWITRTHVIYSYPPDRDEFSHLAFLPRYTLSKRILCY